MPFFSREDGGCGFPVPDGRVFAGGPPSRPYPLKVLSVFGTRPEAIKMAPLVKALQAAPGIQSRVCVTAQHREMLDQVLELFNIQPEMDLDIMQDCQTLTGITCRALRGLEEVFQGEEPHLVLVHGDTTTTFAAGLAAYYRQLKVGHVEAGLRTYRKYAPFPEELNRRLTGVLADLHFAPTARAEENLRGEGVPPENIFVTGNTVIDALQYTVKEGYTFQDPALRGLALPPASPERLLLVEAHRRENLGTPLEEICLALRDLVEGFPDLQVVFPVHKNPRVRETVGRVLSGIPRVHLLEPLGTGDFHNLMARCYLVLTDSGGIQEEAPSLGKPVLVLREVTERPEAVEAGTVRLAGTRRASVREETTRLLRDRGDYLSMSRAINPYGDGRASQRIRDIICYHFGHLTRLPTPFSPGVEKF